MTIRFGIFLSLVVAGSIFARSAGAQSPPITFVPEIPIFGLLEKVITISSTSIGDYIRVIFVAFIWVVGILATVMVVYGGIKWVAAAGNAGRIKDARDIVDNAVIGVVIALTSVVLLNIINPSFTKFNGIVLTDVGKQLAVYLSDMRNSAGSFAQCTKTSVSGLPSKVCSGPTTGAGPNGDVTNGCLDLNEIVNKAAKKYSFLGLDPFSLKAIINIESPKTRDGSPFSGPEGNTTAAHTPGPGYGIGQFKVSTLKEVLTKVNNGGLPPGCHDDQIYDADGVHISQSCKAWLDKRNAGALGTGKSGLEAQVYMIAYYYGHQLQDRQCIKGDYLLGAAAYNQGLHGASVALCSTDIIKDPATTEHIRTKAVAYMQNFNQQYVQACADGL